MQAKNIWNQKLTPEYTRIADAMLVRFNPKHPDNYIVVFRSYGEDDDYDEFEQELADESVVAGDIEVVSDNLYDDFSDDGEFSEEVAYVSEFDRYAYQQWQQQQWEDQ